MTVDVRAPCGCGLYAHAAVAHDRLKRVYVVDVACQHPVGSGCPPWSLRHEVTELAVAKAPGFVVLPTLGSRHEYLNKAQISGDRVTPSPFESVHRTATVRANQIVAGDEFNWSVEGWGDDWWVALRVEWIEASREVRVSARTLDGERYRSRVVKDACVAKVRRAAAELSPPSSGEDLWPRDLIDPQYAPPNLKLGDRVVLNQNGEVRIAMASDRSVPVGTVLSYDARQHTAIIDLGDQAVLVKVAR